MNPQASAGRRPNLDPPVQLARAPWQPRHKANNLYYHPILRHPVKVARLVNNIDIKYNYGEIYTSEEKKSLFSFCRLGA